MNLLRSSALTKPFFMFYAKTSISAQIEKITQSELASKLKLWLPTTAKDCSCGKFSNCVNLIMNKQKYTQPHYWPTDSTHELTKEEAIFCLQLSNGGLEHPITHKSEHRN